MSEALLLVAVILLIPLFGRTHLLWSLLAILIVIPGFWATWTGAPFAPTSKKRMGMMLKMAAIKPGQSVVDLGCGDGRLVFAAAKQKANAVGYEMSIPTFIYAWLLSFLNPRSRIVMGDFWKQDYRKADVVFCYLLTSTMQTFKKTVWPQLKPGCKVISHSFRMKGVKIAAEKEKIVMYVK